MIGLLLGLVISGIVVGGLGRLVVPGPNPMGILPTIAVGLSGSFIGGLIGRLVFGWRYRYSLFFGLILSVLCAAGIIMLLGRHRGPAKEH